MPCSLLYSGPTAIGVISETIRKVTMARSLKNVKTAQVVTLTATHRAITLMDPIAKKSIGQVHVHVYNFLHVSGIRTIDYTCTR